MTDATPEQIVAFLTGGRPMSIPDELRNIRDNLRSGRFGQREIWERQLEKAVVEFERLREQLNNCRLPQQSERELRAEVERLSDEVTRLRMENAALRRALEIK